MRMKKTHRPTIDFVCVFNQTQIPIKAKQAQNPGHELGIPNSTQAGIILKTVKWNISCNAHLYEDNQNTHNQKTQLFASNSDQTTIRPN